MVDQGLERPIAQISEQLEGRYFGKYRGTVESVDDPENLGRITAKVPSVYGDEVSPWAFPAVPFAGDQHGLLFLPKQGDGVWVEFEAGNPSHPIWTGYWWARGEIPAPAGPDQRVIVTPGKLKVILDDSGGGKIQIQHTDQAEITLSNTELSIRFGQAKIVLNAAGVSINDNAFKVI
jgi:uncharacterized protein involved in type VI secretion and phage assembly